jgi:hypothetical protein
LEDQITIGTSDRKPPEKTGETAASFVSIRVVARPHQPSRSQPNLSKRRILR